MSDDSPWQPPTSGNARDESAPVVPSDPSPWSRDAIAGPEPVVPAPPAPPTGERPPPPPPAAPVEPAPAPSDEPVPASSGSRRGLLVAVAACAIVAVGLAGIFAIRQFTGETDGGAASPEELADEFMAAIDGEDVLGVIDVLLPGEREALGEPVIDTVGELQRLDILSSDLDLSALAGVDLQVEQHTVEVEQLGVDDIVMLHMSADVVATIDGAEIPIGEMITDRVPDDALIEMRGSSVTETDTIEASVAAVERNGAWYLSLFYTAAEMARTESDVGALPAEGIGAVGADAPEAVVDLFADHLRTLDVRGLVQMLDPAEAEALQRYAPLFIGEAEAAIAEEADGLEITITDTDVRVDGDGSTRTLFVDGFGIEADIEGTHLAARFANGCVSVSYEDEFGGTESIEQCMGSPDTSLVEEMAGVDVPATIDDFVTAFTEAFSDMEPIGIEVRERDGQWYVSPIATGTEAMLALMRALDRDELDELIDLGSVAVDDFFDVAFGLVPSAITTEEWDDGGWAVEEPADDVFDEDGEWSEYEPSAVDDCYSIDDATEATACFETEIASGTAEDWEMPVSLLAPECGLTELLWSGDVYGMSDEEFTAVMSGAVPCYDQLVAEGYDEWMVPYEVEHIDCFEGLNPYQNFDEEYSDRVFDCAFVLDTEG